jgi:hypothetical protein
VIKLSSKGVEAEHKYKPQFNIDDLFRDGNLVYTDCVLGTRPNKKKIFRI